MQSRGRIDRFSGWLLRPYIDLEASESGPLHAQCVEHGRRAAFDPGAELFHPQRALAPGFRFHLANEAGMPCSVGDPRDLPEEARSERWKELCDRLDGWEGLSTQAKARLASLLHSMCLYSVIIRLNQEAKLDCDRSGEAADLSFWIASAAYINGVPSRISDYHHADLSDLEDIALNRQDAARACFNATAKIFVHKAKTRAAVSDLENWAAHFERSAARAIASMRAFDASLHSSRLYRGLGFLPQRLRDWAELKRVMDLAENHALAMKPENPAQRVLYLENLHALFESRTKEALATGDLDLALQRSLKVIEVDPCDSKAWVELGQVRQLRSEWGEAAQAYAAAGMLGPPAHAVGRHMAGVCLREMGLDMLGAAFFKETLEHDPLGISPIKAIAGLADLPVLTPLKTWSETLRAEL